MGDFYNNSGFYEQSELRRANELAERDQAIVDMAAERSQMMDQLRIEENEKQQKNRTSQVGFGDDPGGSVSSSIGLKKHQQPVKTKPDITFWGIFWRVSCFWVLFPIIAGVIDVGLLHITGFSKYSVEGLSISSMLAALAVALIWFLARYRSIASFYASLGVNFEIKLLISWQLSC